MGDLKGRMPWTHWTMLVGCLAIAGVPLLSGFFSKDEILWSAFRVGGYGHLVWLMGFVVAGLTAFYMFRLYHLTFSGPFRGTEDQAHHLHESPPTMLVPLFVRPSARKELPENLNRLKQRLETNQNDARSESPR